MITLKQREYEEGFDSLAEERNEAMKYHGLDVEYVEYVKYKD